MSLEFQLISAVIREQGFRQAHEAGITSQTFGSIDAQMCWAYLSNFYFNHSHYGENVSAELFAARFPTIELPEPTQSLEALIEYVQDEKLKRDIAELIDEVGIINEDAPNEALATLLEAPQRLLGTRYEDDVDFAQDIGEKIREDYRTIKENKGAGLYPWPWSQMTEAIGGIEKGGLYIFWGTPKSGKTWLGMHTVVNLYQHYSRRVLIYSAEMHEVQLRRRGALLLAGLDYGKYRHGKLSEEEEELLYEYMDELALQARSNLTRERIIFTKGLSRNAELSVRELRAKIDSYKPDIVMLDSAYHMAKGPDWKFITDLSQRVKQEICNTTGVPVVAIIQENERQAMVMGTKGRGTASTAMSPSWVQDCDGGFRVINNDNGFVSIHVSVGREFVSRKSGIRINFRPAYDFSFVDRNLENFAEREEEAQEQEDRPKIRPPRTTGRSLFRPDDDLER